MAKKGLKLFSSSKRRRKEATSPSGPKGGSPGRGEEATAGRRGEELLGAEERQAMLDEDEQLRMEREERERREEEEEQKKAALIEAERFQARHVKILEDEARPLLAGLLSNPGLDPTKWDATDLAHLAIQFAVGLRAAAEETVASIPPPQDTSVEDDILF